LGAEWGLRFANPVSSATFASLAIVGAISLSAPYAGAREDPPLVRLAAVTFPNLTRAESTLLTYADKSNLTRGEFAIAGTSGAPLDPSNDPAHADEWPHDRDIRANLIRWLSIDDAASARVDPDGVRVLGAKIEGPINLSHVRVPFALTLVRCSIPDRMNLYSADLPHINLAGSDTGPIDAANLIVHGDLNFGNPDRDLGGFDASGPVMLSGAKIAGIANFSGGHFHYSENASDALTKSMRIALFVSNAEIKGDLALAFGFESDGCAFVAENVIGGDLNCAGGRFINPGNVALAAGGSDIGGVVIMGPHPLGLGGGFAADGQVMFERSRVGAGFDVVGAKFGGKSWEPHGLFAPEMSVRGEFLWQNVNLENGAILDLTGAHFALLLDQETSWPAPGKLLIDGLTYDALSGGSSFNPTWKSPVDAVTRLRWLALQPGFHPQPYQQLAKVLASSGDDAGAIRVRIAADDLHYSRYGFPGRVWGVFLKVTIGYGHRPMLTIMWSSVVVLVGWLIVRGAKVAAVMRPTYPENALAAGDLRYEHLYPFLYSLDVFLPFVNLHQEHYWWPDADASGRWNVLGVTVNCRGWFVLYYLWAQIIAGWILSAIFVAGVTGLIRGD
jgi:hypothetical protein